MYAVEKTSYLSVAEERVIRTSLHCIDDERFQCFRCPETSREKKMCEKVSTNVHFKLDQDLHFKTCPGNFYRPEIIPLLEMFRSYEAGVMPYPGSLSEQPNKLIEAMGVISQYKHMVKENERRRAAMKARGRGR